MPGRIRVGARFVALALTITAALAVTASAASASEVIYNNVPSPLPGNLPSVGFQATQTSEFGGQVEFAGTARKNPVVQVTMSSWACQSGTWFNHNCTSAGGSKFEWPLTVSIYEVGPGNSVGQKIAASSKVFRMPYRPSFSARCSGANAGKWYHAGTCFNGKAFRLSMPLHVASLPSKVIISVAYNTSNYGAQPQGTQPCSSTEAGCPYDSLNVAVREVGEPGPSVGSDPFPESAYINSTTAGNYCSNPGAVGTFGISENCWNEEQPAFLVKAS